MHLRRYASLVILFVLLLTIMTAPSAVAAEQQEGSLAVDDDSASADSGSLPVENADQLLEEEDFLAADGESAIDTAGMQEAFFPVIEAYRGAIQDGVNMLIGEGGSEYAGAVGFGGFFPECDPQYAFYDVNKDEEPEMLIGTGYSLNEFRVVQIFYCENGQIKRFFDEKHNYMENVYIGANGTIMINCRILVAPIGSTLEIVTIGSSWAEPEAYDSCYCNAIAGGVVMDPDEDYLRMAEGAFAELRDAGCSEVSIEEMDAKREDYIATGLDLTALEWHSFMEQTPSEEVPDETPMPGGEEKDGSFSGEHVYNVYKAPVLNDMEMGTTLALDADGDRFIMVVNLMEYWGVVSGTYTRTDSYLDLNIINTVEGWGEDDVSSLRLSVVGDTFVSSQYFFSVEKNGVFHYEESYTVTGDSGIGIVTGDCVRFRAGPGTDYWILVELYKGDRLEITGRCGDWYQARTRKADGFSSQAYGYISCDYLEKE